MNGFEIKPNHRVLVIDDNRSVHNGFRKFLCSAHPEDDALAAAETAFFSAPAPALRLRFELDSAYQGREGLEFVERALAQQRPYAMAFVDIRMPPGWDGVETITRIWHCDPEIQAVICTAYADYSWDALTARLSHSDQFVVLKKPFEAIEVLQLASALTEKWRLTQQAKNQLARLDQLVDDRTRALRETNEKLQAEIAARKEVIAQLQDALANIKTLSGLLPICSFCKKIRDDKGYWQQVESYVIQHSSAKFTHSLCPDCVQKLYPGLLDSAPGPGSPPDPGSNSS